MEGPAVEIKMKDYPEDCWQREKDVFVMFPKGTSRATAAALGFPLIHCFNTQDQPARDGIKMGLCHGRAYVEALLGRGVQCPLAPAENMRRLEGSQQELEIGYSGVALTGASLAVAVFLEAVHFYCGLPMPLNAATGTLNLEGQVGRVENILDQLQWVANLPLRCVIYPAANAPDLNSCPLRGDPRFKAVKDVREAIAAVSTIAWGTHGGLLMPLLSQDDGNS